MYSAQLAKEELVRRRLQILYGETSVRRGRSDKDNLFLESLAEKLKSDSYPSPGARYVGPTLAEQMGIKDEPTEPEQWGPESFINHRWKNKLHQITDPADIRIIEELWNDSCGDGMVVVPQEFLIERFSDSHPERFELRVYTKTEDQYGKGEKCLVFTGLSIRDLMIDAVNVLAQGGREREKAALVRMVGLIELTSEIVAEQTA